MNKTYLYIRNEYNYLFKCLLLKMNNIIINMKKKILRTHILVNV